MKIDPYASHALADWVKALPGASEVFVMCTVSEWRLKQGFHTALVRVLLEDGYGYHTIQAYMKIPEIRSGDVSVCFSELDVALTSVKEKIAEVLQAWLKMGDGLAEADRLSTEEGLKSCNDS